ncbi:MAG: tRNA (guanosine(46)-N7)-methyltransferase TrmB [Spongiibacteraceae bacterium]
MVEQQDKQAVDLTQERQPEVARHRSIRSFVLRTGRMTPGQQKAYDKYWPEKGLLLQDGVIDPSSVFGRAAALNLEIGFGMGASLVEMAKAAPEQDFIGIEVHVPGVGKLLHGMEEHGVDNIRVYCDDAVEVLKHCIADQSVDRIQIYFPDPWHKKKHHKRRLIQPAFIQTLRQKLKLGGVIHLATDWEHYAEYMMEVMCAAEGFNNTAGEYCFADRPEYRPITKFEKRGERLGHGVWDLLFERIR